MKASAKAYAKINLFLDIDSKRENGYHNIVSIMHTVDLYDNITVEIEKGEEKIITVTCDDFTVPCGKDNLVYKAASIYPISGRINIHINKNIPMSAGLAGGSADAAATLIALNNLSDKHIDLDELCKLGAGLGADIPFCIKKGACLVEGIGELLTPISPMPSYPMVIAREGEGMSTPEGYRQLDVKYNDFKNYNVNYTLLDILKNEKKSPKEFCKGLFNIFESIVEPQRPCVSKIKQTMLQNGADGAMMSGSGTSVFGIFENEENAKKCAEQLKDQGAFAYFCYPYIP